MSRTRARNRFERVRQVEQWLAAEFPVGRPVKVAWRDEVRDKDRKTGKVIQYYGDCDRKGRAFVIRMSRRRCRRWEDAIDTLIHEWAHAKLWGPASLECHDKTEHHPDEFWALYVSIKRRWEEDGGWEQAGEYPVK